MLKKRNAQGLSITTIVVAVIALIIIVVLIAIFSGRMALFGTGLDESKTCSSICSSLGKSMVQEVAKDCTDDKRHMWGTFADVSGTKSVEIEAAKPDTNNCFNEETDEYELCGNAEPAEMEDKEIVCCCK